MSEMTASSQSELVVNVHCDENGMWCVAGDGVCGFTDASTLDELRANLREAVALHFEKEKPPSRV